MILMELDLSEHMLKVKGSLLVLLLIIVVHAFILYKLIFFPYPELFVYPYLTNHGLKPYSQILDQHFPGLMFLPINLDNLGMNDELTARIWLVSIVVLTQILIFWVSRTILKSNKKALLVNLLYLIWQPFFEGWVLWLDSFLPLFLLPAFYFTHQIIDSHKNVFKLSFLLGLSLGVGIIFKQVLIPLSIIILLYIIWQKRNLKVAIPFMISFFLPILIVIYYLFSIGVIKDFWYWTITFNLITFAQFGRKAATLSQMMRVLFVSFFAFFLILKQKKFYHIYLFILLPIVEIYSRFDFVHFQPALPFVLIATVDGLSALNRKYLKILASLYFFVSIWWMIIFYRGHIGGDVKFFDSDTKLISTKIKQNTSKNEHIFIFGSVPHLYQMSQTLPTGDVFVFPFPWFLMVSEERLLEGIIKDQPQIIVADRSVVIEGSKITDFAKKLDNYITENYQTFDHVGNTQIMRRKIR